MTGPPANALNLSCNPPAVQRNQSPAGAKSSNVKRLLSHAIACYRYLYVVASRPLPAANSLSLVIDLDHLRTELQGLVGQGTLGSDVSGFT